jgi:hypothetical protein
MRRMNGDVTHCIKSSLELKIINSTFKSKLVRFQHALKLYLDLMIGKALLTKL